MFVVNSPCVPLSECLPCRPHGSGGGASNEEVDFVKLDEFSNTRNDVPIRADPRRPVPTRANPMCRGLSRASIGPRIPSNIPLRCVPIRVSTRPNTCCKVRDNRYRASHGNTRPDCATCAHTFRHGRAHADLLRLVESRASTCQPWRAFVASGRAVLGKAVA